MITVIIFHGVGQLEIHDVQVFLKRTQIIRKTNERLYLPSGLLQVLLASHMSERGAFNDALLNILDSREGGRTLSVSNSGGDREDQYCSKVRRKSVATLN